MLVSDYTALIRHYDNKGNLFAELKLAQSYFFNIAWDALKKAAKDWLQQSLNVRVVFIKETLWYDGTVTKTVDEFKPEHVL